MQPFFTRRRTVMLLVVFAVAFLVWFAVIASGNSSDDTSRSGAEAAGYWVGSMLAAPAVLALITISPVWLIMYVTYRRSR